MRPHPFSLADMNANAVWYRQRGCLLSYAMLATILGTLAITIPGSFYSVTNLSNLAGQMPPLFLVAIGQTFVLLGAGFDLSVGSVISLCSAILTLDMPATIKMPLALAVAASVGLVNGAGIVRLGVHPIIMTLATSSILQGFALILRPTPGGTVPDILITAATFSAFGAPAGLFWILLAAGAAICLMHRTTFGGRLYAVGRNPQTARYAGIDADTIRIATYVICALTAALAAAYLTGRLASGDPNVGRTLGLDSVLGAALGGTLLSGGMGGPLGTISGVLILVCLNNGLNLAGVTPFYQFILKGVMLIVAVSLFRRREMGL